MSYPLHHTQVSIIYTHTHTHTHTHNYMSLHIIIHVSTRTCHIHHKRRVAEVWHIAQFWVSYGICAIRLGGAREKYKDTCPFVCFWDSSWQSCHAWIMYRSVCRVILVEKLQFSFILISFSHRSMTLLTLLLSFLKMACLYESFTTSEHFCKLSKMYCFLVLFSTFFPSEVSEIRNFTIKHRSSYCTLFHPSISTYVVDHFR